jgi:hypothetical protein
MSRRGKRGLASCSKKCNFRIEFDEDMQPIGENAAYFVSWTGCQVREEFEYYTDTKDFSPEKWEKLCFDTRVMCLIVLLKNSEYLLTLMSKYLFCNYLGDLEYYK